MWALLLHCASARANYFFRVVRPELVRGFAERHDSSLWTCMCEILRVWTQVKVVQRSQLRNVASCVGRCWSQKCGSHKWFSELGELGFCVGHDQATSSRSSHRIIGELEGNPTTPNLRALADTRRLTGVYGFEPPGWRALAEGLRPQFGLSSMSTSEQALRSYSGPGAGVPLSVALASALTRIDSHFFRLLLLRRLHLHLPHSSVRCRCGRPFDPFGHRAACTSTGELRRRAFVVESAGARMCREAGGRVVVNVIRDMDIAAPDPRDGRCLEIGGWVAFV